MTQRTDRIDELFRQEIGEIFRRDVDDPRIGFATITDVETTPDLRHARVSVSVIGQPDERKATLAAMGRAMPFVRHELGKRLRLKRIPQFHLELDDTLERGTRVLHLLNEIEAGTDRTTTCRRSASRCRRRSPRLPHEGDADDVPALPTVPPGKTSKPRRRSSRPTVDRDRDAAARGSTRGDRPLAMDAGRPRGRRRRGSAPPGASSRSATRTPTPTRSARPSRSARLVAACGGIATPVFADPMPPLYAFLAGHRDRPDGPGARRRLRPARRVGLRPASTGSARSPVAIRSCSSALPRVVLDHHASNDETGPADWVDPAAAATCEMAALLAARLGVPLDEGGGALAAAADGRDRDGHGDVRPPQRDAADARGRRGARRRRGAAVGHLAPALPLEARGPAAAVRRRPRTARDGRRRADRPRLALRRRPRGDRRDPGPLRGDHRPARPGRGGGRRDHLQGERPGPPG